MADSPPSPRRGPDDWLPPEAPGARPELGGERPARDEPAPSPSPHGGLSPAPAPAPPGNDAAVAGFVLSVSGLVLLVLSVGLLSIVSLPCAVLGIVFARNGKRRLAAGETARYGGLAQAGFVIGIVALSLSLLVLAVLIALIGSGSPLIDEFQRGFEEGLREQQR